MVKKTLLIFSFFLLLAGCSNLKTYPNDLNKNVFVNVKIESAVKARVDIFEVNKKCEAEYVGTVDFDEKKKNIGLKKSTLVYLDFRFITSGFFSSSTSSSGLSTLIKPRKGYLYDVSVSYEDSIYDVEIREKRRKRKKGRELKITPLGECSEFK